MGLDLVEISPDANPPVCKIVDYGKYRYELARKETRIKQLEMEKEDLLLPVSALNKTGVDEVLSCLGQIIEADESND